MRGIKAALLLTNEKYKLMAFGLAITLLLQTFIILAGVTKLLPLTGITLPLLVMVVVLWFHLSFH